MLFLLLSSHFCAFTSGFLTADNKKSCGNFQNENYRSCVSCDFTICTQNNCIKIQKICTKTPLLCMSTCGMISKQVFRLASYKAVALHFYILPSQFPNDRFSPTNIKTFDAYGDSITVGDSHPIPFSPAIPERNG